MQVPEVHKLLDDLDSKCQQLGHAMGVPPPLRTLLAAVKEVVRMDLSERSTRSRSDSHASRSRAIKVAFVYNYLTKRRRLE